MTIMLDGKEYPMAMTLRVAYMIQGQHNHTSYMEVFKTLDTMTIEDQIGVLYAAFACANRDEARTMTRQKFTDYYLDNVTLREIMQQLEVIVKTIVGDDEVANEGAAGEAKAE